MNNVFLKRLPVLGVVLLFSTSVWASDPLPSWNDSVAKQSVIAFVEKITTEGSRDYVAPEDRIATFDNDGTLWSEQPFYFQATYAFDRVKKLAPQHPEWKSKEPFASVLKGDIKSALSSDKKGILELLMATHGGMTSTEFTVLVKDWISTAKHPTTGRHYNKMVYQPMLELLEYLRANGFKTFIVSGGGIDFMRPWTQETYGIPPEQVIGSSVKTKYEVRNGVPVIIRIPEIDFIDDKEGKPVGIQRHIGKRPIFAAGNSDGDFQMLEWTTSGEGPRFALYIHHTDGDREWAYDRESPIGKLDRGLDEGKKRGWTFVDMKNDWNKIYPEDAPQTSFIGNWMVEVIGGRGVVDDSLVTLEFAEDGTVSGSSGVNRFRGTASIEDGKLAFGPIAMTRRAGPPELMRQEADLMNALQNVAAFRIGEDDRLYLINTAGDETIRLSRE